MPRSKQYGVRVYRRDGSTFVLGPFGSKAEAADNRPTGATILSSQVFRFQEDVSGPPRIVKEQHIVTETPAVFTVVGLNAPGDPGEIRMTGLGFSTLERWVVYYDSGNQSVEFNPPYEVDSDVQVVDTDAALEDQVVTKVELYDGESLQLTVDGLALPIPGQPVTRLITSVVQDGPGGDVIFTGVGFTGVLTMSISGTTAGNPYGPTFGFTEGIHFTVDSDTQITFLYQALVDNGFHQEPASLTGGTFNWIDGDVGWSDNVLIQPVTMFAMQSAYSPDVETIHITGTDLDTLSIVAPYFNPGQIGGMGVANPNVHPNAATINSNNGTTIITWTDTDIEFSNPLFGNGNVTHIEGYLLGSGTPDADFDCPDFLVAAPSSPAGYTLTSGYGFGQDRGGVSVTHDNDLDRWVVAADVDDGSGNLTPALWRFAEDGAIDTGFGITDNGLTRIPSTPYSEAVGVGFVPADGSYILVFNDGFNTGTKTLKAVKVQGLAGAIDTSWGVNGFVTLAADAYGVRGAVHVEADGSIVAAWNDYPGVAAPGRVYRWDADGVLQDQVSISEGPIRGFTRDGNFASGQYAVAVRNPANGDFWAAKVDLDTQTYDISNIASDHIDWGAAGFVSLAVDDNGRVYIAAPSAASSTTLRVIRFLSDMTYEGIFQDATDGGIAQMYMVDGLVYDLDGDQGLMAVGTLIPNSGPIQWVFFRFEEGGAQTTFDYYTLGTGGPDWSYAARHDGSGKVIVVGSVDGDAVIARVDDTTGALDPTFG